VPADDRPETERTIADVTGALRHDPEAFSRLFARFAPRLRLLVEARLGRHLRRRIAADDILQVTFLEAFRTLDRFEDRGPGSFYRWLGYLAKQRVIDAARHHGAAYQDMRRDLTAEGGEGERGALLRQLAASVSTPSGRAEVTELRTRIAEALHELPDVHRNVLIQHDLEKRTYEEIGRDLGKSKAWVCGKRAEALALLKGRLEGVYAA